MNQSPQFGEHLNYAHLLFEQGKDLTFIETKLKEKNIEQQDLEEILKQLKRLNHIQRNKKGVQLILLGVILLGVGFITSILLHLNGSTSLDFPLYGLTATGIVVLIVGLVYLFH